MKIPKRMLALESLESREMLASVQVVDGVLQLFGDENDDRFVVTQSDEGIRVSSPRLNGTAFGIVNVAKSEFRSIDVRLFEGLDSVTFEMVELNQPISIRGGEGIDVVRFSGFSNQFVKRVPDVSFFGEGGRDEFIARDSWFQKVTLNMGSGTGFVKLQDSTVLKEFSASMADGDDSIIFDKSEFRRFVKIDTGNGGRGVQMDNNKFLGSLRVTNIQKRDNVSRNLWFRENTVGRDVNFRLGDGPDEVMVRSNFIEGLLRISGDMTASSPAGGDDLIRVFNNVIEGDLRISGNVGDDEIRIRGTEMNNLVLRGHAGDDQVVVQRIDAVMVDMVLGDGNDSVLLELSRIGGPLSIAGQAGDDLIFGFANEIVGTSEFAGGTGNDQLSSIQSEYADAARFLGQANDDEITLFANSLLGDASILGGSGTDGYSAGLGIGDESNFFGGAFEKKSISDIAAPDFRAIRDSLRA